MVGTGLGARRGVLFKNATSLETSARITTAGEQCQPAQ
jgi:Cu2+-exporting ATPase